LPVFEDMSQLEINDKLIEKKRFLNHRDIHDIVIGEDTNIIEDWAFAGCRNLRRVTLKNRNIVIGKDVFLNCKNLKEIVVENNISLKRLLVYAFTVFDNTELRKLSLTGQNSYMEMFDKTLMNFLRQDDLEGFSPFLAGGEEDYEEEGNRPEYYKTKRRMKKAEIITERMLVEGVYPVADKDREYYITYLQTTNETYELLISEEDLFYERFLLYDSLGLISFIRIQKLLNQMPESMVEARALLLRKKNSCDVNEDVFTLYDL